MLLDNTKIIRNLSYSEIRTIIEERDKVSQEFWTLHKQNLNLTALKEGSSLHLQCIDVNPKLDWNRFEQFPKTVKFLQSLHEGNLGRVYWHCLKPKQKIEKHSDRIPFISCGRKFLSRYQIYLNVHRDLNLIIDNKPVIDSSIYTNTIVEFDLKKTHYYYNGSSENFYILVFDFLNFSNLE